MSSSTTSSVISTFTKYTSYFFIFLFFFTTIITPIQIFSLLLKKSTPFSICFPLPHSAHASCNQQTLLLVIYYIFFPPTPYPCQPLYIFLFTFYNSYETYRARHRYKTLVSPYFSTPVRNSPILLHHPNIILKATWKTYNCILSF